MRRDIVWKGWTNLALVLIALVVVFGPQISSSLNFFGNQDAIRQGLDLKGGIELILAPDYRVEDRVLLGVKDQLVARISKLGIAEPKFNTLGTMENNKYDGLKFTFASPGEVERVLNAKAIPAQLAWKHGIEDLTIQFKVKKSSNPNILLVNVQLDPASYGEDAMFRAKEIISRRINSMGTSETDVRLDKKNNRIQVQLPGVSSIDEAEKLLKATGRLNFRMNGKIVMFGNDLKDASAAYDPNKGEPVIHFQFGSEGAEQFRVITTNNVGKKLGMYLDEQQLMEPVINEPIPGGSGEISLGGGTTLDQAKEYAILMKSGALPISLRTVQNTQVAPTLGSEMIRQSLIGAAAGIILVMLFMLLFYSLPGLIANVALIGYSILVLGVMAGLRQVLTLPGVAGFILSIGMAVDANIIIFERIKDELRNGKRLRAAVEAGFNRAFTAIFDSQLTTLIIAVVLLIFGTGPVKGFAVTLTIGILLSLYTAILVSRNLLEMLVDKNPDRYAKYFGA
jgi:protein-export SecD/SecF family membrane protein